jgi:hypothetical protein
MTEPTRNTVRRYFASGPCWICGRKLGAAHRLIDTLRGEYRNGRSIRQLADEYGRPYRVIAYIVKTPIRKLDWIRRFRGANDD